MKILLLLLTTLSLIACDKQSSDGTRERAQAEQEGANNFIKEKARLMELDLRQRYRFYTGVSHSYTGIFKIKENKYQARIIFSPTMHIVESERVRTLEEIQDDLNNLFLRAQIVMWRPSDDVGLFGCTFDRIRPDIMNGVINLVAENCNISLVIKLTIPGTPEKEQAMTGRLLSEALRNGTQKEVRHLSGDANSKLNPAKYSFNVSIEESVKE